jgi:solute carrier family 35 (GDP-fucose transporter), member C1
MCGAGPALRACSSSEYKFPYPLFVTWYQLVVALVLLVVFGELGKRSATLRATLSGHTRTHVDRRAGWGWCRVPALAFVAPFQFRVPVAQSVFPLTLCYVGMLVFNNICLQYVEVTFYQVRSAPTPTLL